MRAGDRIRLAQLAIYGAAVPIVVISLLSFVTGSPPIWWAPVIGVASGAFTVWAAWSMFGLSHVVDLAARAVHGGRHYFFEHEEIHVLFDEHGAPWLKLADVRRCIGGDPRRLRHYGSAEMGCFEGEGRDVFLSEAGVRRWIRTSRHRDRPGFLLWYERDFLMPLENRRRRGMRLHATGAGHP